MMQVMVKLRDEHERISELNAVVSANSFTDAVEEFYNRYGDLIGKWHIDDDSLEDKFDFLILR